MSARFCIFRETVCEASGQYREEVYDARGIFVAFVCGPEGCEVRLTAPAGWRRLIDLQTERDRLLADRAGLKRERAGLKRRLTELQREAGS
jgi:hypothetical protein